MLLQRFRDVFSAGGIGIPPADLRLQDFLLHRAVLVMKSMSAAR